MVEKSRTEKELVALDALPYEEDVELAWEAPPGPDLPYNGHVPTEVLHLAEALRRSRT